MNQKIVKRLRRVSKNLPDVPVTKQIIEKVYGRDLPKEMTEVGGKPIDPKALYTGKKNIRVMADHYARLKKIYLTDGQPGVISYAGAVMRYNTYLQKQQQERQRNPELQEKANMNLDVI